MLTQTKQIKMLLSNLENNIRTLLQEREKYAPEIEKLKSRIIELEKENEELRLKIKSEEDN